MHSRIRNIAFAGSGNVAFHLAKGMKEQGFRISGIWSRDFSHSKALAGIVDSVAYTEMPELCKGADLILIAVPDKAIESVAQMIGNYDGIVAHTAGSVPIDVLRSTFQHCGILYPLQTFSKETGLNLAEVPFFIEASSPADRQEIYALASKLSHKVYDADSAQRMMLHTAAVFAGNYSNLMYIISHELIRGTGMPAEVLNPLILETARKATTGDPLKMQTGPARRNDTITIEKHIASLADHQEYAELYRLLANLIIEKYK